MLKLNILTTRLVPHTKSDGETSAACQ